MTVMDPRPWSPTGPHIGPDDEDLLMLEPTGDLEADLGSAVLAVHRVGAAACEAVARAPLPDEFRLVDGLAEARAALAAPAVEAISKCVSSDNPRGYADLLLRDTFDTGEAGALAVYRACVAKGVAPPLAAQRAGLIYGVPHDELGRYIGVAADPRAHPVAIADAADRAVTKWASGVVRDEAVSELVSKEVQHPDVQQYNNTVFGQEHPKGRAGRFVATMEPPAPVVGAAPTAQQVAGKPVGLLARLRRDTGVGYQAAPEVAPEVLAPAAIAPSPPRAQRKQRAQRRQRTAGTPMAQGKLKASLNSKLTALLQPGLKARLDAQRLKPTGGPRLDDNPYDDDQAAIGAQFPDRLDTRLAWSMTLAQANEVFRDAKGKGDEASPKTAQMGQLQGLLREPTKWDHGHEDKMRTLAEDAGGDAQPRFIHIDSEELEVAGIDPDQTNKSVEEDIWEYVRLKGYDDQLAHEPGGVYNPVLKSMMGVAPSATVGARDWYLVLNPQAVVHQRPENAPLTAAAEFVIVDDSGNTARLHRSADEDGLHYEFDPTQHWVIYEPRTLWKQTGLETGYWVDRYTLQPLESWREPKRLSKAVLTEQRWRTEPRNAQGEWSRTGGGLLARVKPKPATVVTPVVTPIEPRAAQRKQRAQRAARLAPAAVNGELKSSLSSPLTAQMRSALQSAMETVAAEQAAQIDDEIGVKDDQERYKVFTAGEWQSFASEVGYTGFADAGKLDRIAIPHAALDTLLAPEPDFDKQKLLTGDQADSKLRINVESHIAQYHQGLRRRVPSLDRRMNSASKAHWEGLLRSIHTYMQENPSVVSAMIDMENIDKETGDADFEIRVNTQPVPPQTVVIFPDDFDHRGQLMLRWEKTVRQSSFSSVLADHTMIVDAPLQIYRVTRAQHEVWHAEE